MSIDDPFGGADLDSSREARRADVPTPGQRGTVDLSGVRTNLQASKTVVRPPTGQAEPPATRARPRSEQPHLPPDEHAPPLFGSRPGFDLDGAGDRGPNELLDGAAPLLLLASQLQRVQEHPNADGLRHHVNEQLNRFRMQGPPALVEHASYLLCTFIDEVVLSKNWASANEWRARPLLAEFHADNRGGEITFARLDQEYLPQMTRCADLIELFYVVLSLGFEGKFRQVDGGRNILEDKRRQLYQAITAQGGGAATGLSPQWQGIASPQSRIARYVPWWIFAGVSGLVLFAMFMFFNTRLAEQSDTLADRILDIGRFEMKVARSTPPPAPLPRLPEVQATPVTPKPQLHDLLSPEISAQRLLVVDDPGRGRSVVVIRGDELFAPGKARLQPAIRPLIDRIARALDEVDGFVHVTGHTDNRPIRTPRFPSNGVLSQARADDVMGYLVSSMRDPSRVHAHGCAAHVPVASNESVAGRSQNRRVEIFLSPNRLPLTPCG